MSKTDNKYWLALSPTAFIDNIENKKILLYNTLTGDFMVSSETSLIDIVNRMYIPVNTGVIKYENEMEKYVDLQKAIELDLFLLIEYKEDEKPVNLLPILNLQSDLECCDGFSIEERLMELGNKLRFLSGARIFMSNKLCIESNSEMSLFRNMACRQYAVPEYKYVNEEFSDELLLNVLEQLWMSSISKIDIVIGVNHNTTVSFRNKMRILNSFDFSYVFNCYIEDMAFILESLSAVCFTKKCSIVVFLDRYSEQDVFRDFVLEEQGEYTVYFKKMVSSDADLDKECEMVSFVPLWTGDNEDFFQKYVMLNKSDLHNRKLTMEDFFRNMKLNCNTFGIVDIFPSGAVYACNSKICLGNVGDCRIAEIVNRELKDNTSWRKTRRHTSCKDCVYRYLCPPPASFEMLYAQTIKCRMKI